MEHITVCVCTHRRPELLKKLLTELDRQETNGLFTYSVVVADNDVEQSAEAVVKECASKASVRLLYCVEPRRNIALARNKALALAEGNYVAWIDDDEYPLRDWLLKLFSTCTQTGAAGVLGPVKPYFEVDPPNWVKNGRFFERPSHATGYRITLADARTGNCLLRNDVGAGGRRGFREEFGTGGEDVDFFRNLMAEGATFLWCDEAPVFEYVPTSRSSRGFLLRRAILRGRNSVKHRTGRVKRVITSLIAVPIYAFTLPFMFLGGQHRVMRRLVSFCDHVGRLLAVCGVYPIRERDV